MTKDQQYLESIPDREKTMEVTVQSLQREVALANAEAEAARAALGDMREVLLLAGYATATRESSVRDLRDLVRARNDAIGERDTARAEVARLVGILRDIANEDYRGNRSMAAHKAWSALKAGQEGGRG